MSTYPKISIVTPSYNQASYLEETILSILNQDYPNLEYIIIDGGSTDGSVEIIKKYKSELKYWVSEPDKGQLDAIYKGLYYCTGEIFNWINSDDILKEGILKHIASLYKPGYMVAGKVLNQYDENKLFNDYTKNKLINFNDMVNFKSIYHQPGLWLDLMRLKAIPKIPISFHYYFDKMIYIHYLFENNNVVYTDQTLANFRIHKDAKTSTIQKKSIKELEIFLTELSADLLFSNKHTCIKNSIEKNLIIPRNLTLLIEDNLTKTKIKRLLGYLMFGIINPNYLKSRLYYTLFKKHFLTKTR